MPFRAFDEDTRFLLRWLYDAELARLSLANISAEQRAVLEARLGENLVQAAKAGVREPETLRALMLAGIDY